MILDAVVIRCLSLQNLYGTRFNTDRRVPLSSPSLGQEKNSYQTSKGHIKECSAIRSGVNQQD